VNDVIEAIRLISLKLLERREHSSAELRSKLKLRGFRNSDVDPVLRQLEIENLLSSTRFVEQYLHSRTARGFGPLRIRYELIERGIDNVQIEDAMNTWSGNWDRVLSQVYRKKYSADLGCAEPERSKRVRYLLQRGFTMDQIDRLLCGLDNLKAELVDREDLVR
jgi:regulatory protein